MSERSIKEFLNIHSLRATITKEQDEKLNKLGFGSKIPTEFYVKTKGYEEYFKNPFARYLSSGMMESLKMPNKLFQPTASAAAELGRYDNQK